MKNWTDPFEVYYDLSRLVERMHAGHATGVDRVDLHYALWTRARANEWRGVVQRSNGFVLLKEDYVDTLLELLSRGWLGFDAESTASILEQPRGWRRESRMALREKFARGSFGGVVAERGFAVALWSRLSCFSRGSCARWEGSENAMYVNIGHCFRFECALDSITDNTRRIYFLHDVIPLTHPEYQKPTSAAHFKKFYKYVGHPKSNVLVSSRSTARAIEVLRNGERKYSDSVASVQVLPLAVEDSFRAKLVEASGAKYYRGKKTKRYFLSVGTLEPRKNIDVLLSVWEQMSAMDIEVPSLLLAGKLGWFQPGQRERLKKLESSGLVEVRTGLEDSDLQSLMHGACALLFPSVAEGWGLPLTEALSLGVPVLASDLPVFREVGQGVPELLSPHAVELWRDAVLDYCSPDSGRRHEQMQRLSSYQPVTWEEHFEQLSRVLEN